MLIGWAIVLTLVPPSATADDAAPAARRPNVLVIVADDLGYADLGCQGGREIPTPHIDALAAGGVRCTQGYVTCPVCSPTRAALLVGRYQQRFGHEFNPGPAPEETFGLPLSETTLANRLRAAGYKTGLVGKWHLGAAERFRPLHRGFDEFFGFLGGAHTYWPARKPNLASVLRGNEPVKEPQYLTRAFAREAVEFVDRHQDEPFFLYLAFNAVHAPMEQAPPRIARQFAGIADERRRTFAGMLTALDQAVGRVLDHLEQLKLADNTLVFFLSDNGGPTGVNTARNDPLRGTKSQVYEGGIRVPFLVRWPTRLPAGQTFDRPVVSLDVVPTVLAAVGADAGGAQLDGVDLALYFRGERAAAPHETLYWRFGAQTAVRHGDLKLVRSGDGPAQLYDLAIDVAERHDLAVERADDVARLSALWAAWNAELAAPLWPGRQARRVNRVR